MSSDETSTSRRPKRRCSRVSRFASATVPSAVHYVGYVEDDETPEMIMAKFAELQRIQEQALQKKHHMREGDNLNTRKVNERIDSASLNLDQSDSTANDLGAAESDPRDASNVNDSGNNEKGSVTVEDATMELESAVKTKEEGVEEPLSDDILLQVFKQTSMFNVRTALQDNLMLMGIDGMLDYAQERYGNEDPVSEDEDFIRSFWSDDDGMADSDSEEERGSRRARRKASGGQRGPRPARVKHRMVTAYNPATQALVRRKVRISGQEEITQIRIPGPPLPLAWGRTVKPYVPTDRKTQKIANRHSTGDISSICEADMKFESKNQDLVGADISLHVPDTPPQASGNISIRVPCMEDIHHALSSEKKYVAALVNPCWEIKGKKGLDALGSLANLNLPKLVPEGFVFIWTPKQHISSICKLMTRWGYVYIENLTWVYLGSNNKILRLPSRFVRSSHMTLYMFRMADKGKTIELRHQRNPDVLFDCMVRSFENLAASNDVCRDTLGNNLAPDETFVTIETLLPTAKGKLLELWAPSGMQRSGWTHVIQEQR